LTVVAFAPGRVNLIGEHTDYNDGLCLPFTIARGVTVRARPRDAGTVHVDALTLGESDEFDPASPPRADGWRAFVRGVVAELRGAGHSVPPASLEISSDLPAGAGLSSSAALEVALALALLALAGEVTPDRRWLAHLCSRVENEWVGAHTGLLDQLATLYGEEHAALLIDFRTEEIERVPMELGGWTLATIDSGASRNLAGSGYNERRHQCRRAAELLGIGSLRDATAADFERLPDPLGRRVRHVISENERVRLAAAALRARDLDALAELLDRSHASLRDDFEVSVPAVERTVARVRAAGARGARLIGGGFGGSVLALFGPGVAPPPDAVTATPGPGAALLARIY
jgi:galactokinase